MRAFLYDNIKKTYIFSSWSDGGAQTHTITAPATNATYTARFRVSHRRGGSRPGPAPPRPCRHPADSAARKSRSTSRPEPPRSPPAADSPFVELSHVSSFSTSQGRLASLAAGAGCGRPQAAVLAGATRAPERRPESGRTAVPRYADGRSASRSSSATTSPGFCPRASAIRSSRTRILALDADHDPQPRAGSPAMLLDQRGVDQRELGIEVARARIRSRSRDLWP